MTDKQTKTMDNNEQKCNVEITKKDIKETIESLHSIFQKELFECNQQDLEEKYWHFKYNEKLSLERNLYHFYDMLRLYGNFCRRWEEHKNGSCCVVERVRDKYLMPQINQFVKMVKEIESRTPPLDRTPNGNITDKNNK